MVSDSDIYKNESSVISQPSHEKFIIDGQQRLTSLTLLLIFLNNLQKGKEDAEPIDECIFSKKYGEKSFNINVPERNDCMESLFNKGDYEVINPSESIDNLVNRYKDIVEIFPEELKEKTLPYFIDWLLEKVHLVEITASSEEDAYAIFETMNDRGLSLSATDMLKGYLLANINNIEQRNQSNIILKNWLLKFSEKGKETETDFFKTWLRSQYALDIRDRKKNAEPKDFDIIGTQYHQWVRDNRDLLGLKESSDYYQWINTNFSYYAKVYLNLLKYASAESLKDLNGLDYIRYNADHGFTQQFQLLLAPLIPTDKPEITNRKLALVAGYIDCWLNRRIWNLKSTNYSDVNYTVFQLTKELRKRQEVEELKSFLIERLTKENQELNFEKQPYLNNWSKSRLHRQLARMIGWLEGQSGQNNRYLEYIVRSGHNHWELTLSPLIAVAI